MIIQSATATNSEIVGGKAANLAQLKAAGFDVPDFIALGDAAFDEDGSPKRGLKSQLSRALKSIGPGPFAVRSSGVDEDGAENSHAGQFDTVLNVPASKVLGAAQQVRASGMGAVVATYRAERGLDSQHLPSVLIQRMVPARSAGIAFSADPVSGLRGRVVVSAIAGLGDALVGGEEDGESWIIGPEGALIDAPETAEVLTPDEARKVADLAHQCEATFGSPQDIEWAFDHDQLFLLQSRPITTDLRPAPAPDTALVVLDNSNIVESYPGLVSPLTYSFAAYSYDRVYRAFVKLLGLSNRRIGENGPIFANLLARIDGRVYYNLGNWYRALALLPGFSLNRGYMETMMGVSEPLPEELTQSIGPAPATGRAKALEWARVLRVAGGLAMQATLLPRTKRRFMARLNAALSEGPDLPAANLTELANTYRRIEGDLLDKWDAPLINDFLCMIGFGGSRALLEKWAGPDGVALHNELMIGQGDIISAEPAQRIADMAAMVRAENAQDALSGGRAGLDAHPKIAAAFDDYLRVFGDRCTQELKLESIPLSDDPAPLIAAIEAGALRPPRSHEPREAVDWVQAIPGSALRRFVARKFCQWGGARVRDRENLRFERTRIFAYARRVFLAMGREFHAMGVLNTPRDIFFLTVPEVLGAIEGAGLSAKLNALVEQRRGEMNAAATREDPPERLLVRGAAITAAHSQSQSAPAAPEGDSRQGTGCSAGVVRAKARVINDPRTENLLPDEVLVARNTDPGWIAVFANAAAIVVERGSLLSHSAIVAREMGIPCVVGIGDATRWVETGDVIELNGATGEVRKCYD